MVERQPMLFPDNAGSSGVLIDSEIEEAVQSNWLISKETFQSSSLEASSYDIRVGAKGVLGGEGIELDLRTHSMELCPGAYGGIISQEKLSLPERICARIGSKRALSYEGVILLTGSIIDPGYEGHLLFGVYNASQRKVLIRYGKKLCNVVFERLSKPPERFAPNDPSLKIGNFPDAFLDRMANMEVLPWMQISDRVKQIESITKDILDLKARYDDVLKPIRDLTENVKSLTKDVTSLTGQTKNIADDVESLNKLVSENSTQIHQLTANLGTVGVMIQTVQDRTRGLEETGKSQQQAVSDIRASFGRFQVLIYIFWAILLLLAGAFLPGAVDRIWPKHDQHVTTPGEAQRGTPQNAPPK